MQELLTFLLSCAVCWVLGDPGDQSSLPGLDCALLSAQGPHTKYLVTDGNELVISTWNARRQLISCSVSQDKEMIDSFLLRCTSGRQELDKDNGYGGFAEARLACLVFLQSNPPVRRTKHTQQHARIKRGLTYPGTLWCGAGNIADTDADLGEHKETDSCCRTHDHCEYVIHPFTYNYGYRNLRWHTISHCQCDNKFKECLRKVNDTASRVVGQTFFNIIQVQCFEFTTEEQCVERNWYGWCNKYANVTMVLPQDSGLYDYGGNLIDQPALPKERDSTKPPSVEMSPTLGQVLQATEDLLKVMVSVSPTTSPNQSKVDTTTAKKKKPKKERKQKKGKGLKGKRKNKSKNIESTAKDIWSEDLVKNEETLFENQPLDILERGPKQDTFNDILNDEPIRTGDTNTPTPVLPTTEKEEFKSKITSPPPVSGACTQKPRRNNRREQKERRQRKKKPNKHSCGPSTAQ